MQDKTLPADKKIKAWDTFMHFMYFALFSTFFQQTITKSITVVVRAIIFKEFAELTQTGPEEIALSEEELKVHEKETDKFEEIVEESLKQLASQKVFLSLQQICTGKLQGGDVKMVMPKSIFMEHIQDIFDRASASFFSSSTPSLLSAFGDSLIIGP